MNAPLFTLFSIRVTPLFLLGTITATLLMLDALMLLLAPGREGPLRRSLPGAKALLRHPGAAFTSSGEIRVAGLLVLGLLSWVVYDMLHRSV